MATSAGLPGSDGSRGARELSGFQRYYRTIREHLRLIAACVVVTLLAAVAYVEVAPRSYTAESQLLINPAGQQDTLLFSLPVLHSTGDPAQDVLTASGLITTPQVAAGVIQTLHLHTTPSALLGEVQATPLAQSNIIAVEASDSSAARAQLIANAFASETVAVRTAALHRAISVQIPGLTARVAALPPGDRSAAGSLGDQLNRLEQLLQSNDPTISFSSAATLPSAPTSPRKSLSLAAGLLVGLLIGIGGAFAFDALDPRVRREEQLRERFSRIPVLARIPRVGRKERPGPLTPLDLSGPALEQYRTLRATLSAGASTRAAARGTRASSVDPRASGKSQAYLITGSAPSEGKTTTAISLAAVLAQGGGSVILLDADLRRPTIASAFGVTDFYGTEQVLNGDVSLTRALVPVQLGSSSIRVLAAHTHSAELADRLSVAAIRQLVGEAKNQADFVVIDSPPLIAVPDALPMTQVVDELVVAVRVGHSRLNSLADLWELLGQQGISPTGIVLIGVPEQHGYEYAYPMAQDHAWPEPDGEPLRERRPLPRRPARNA